ncbi:histone-lysine N-methyltransferase SETDB2 isoform X5 [Mirounga angustirostris]|uniref:PHD finger protein 11 isoform X1 n=1 Tax=Mirounga leonina TaxID=9715 RepID=UPI00156BEB91|nr:PHD finger protein 11 isoform X1 [Mirounga leonina]
MDQVSSSMAKSAHGASRPEAQDAQHQLPHPTGVFQVAEKMEKRTCALCPKDIEYNVLYFAQSENIAAHENCLLYSSALVECEDHDPRNQDRNFDVESVKKEIHRGRKLKCAFCNERGATVGCDLKACNKSYHFFCAKNDHAVLQTDGSRGIYKMFCKQHAPLNNAHNDLLTGTSLSGTFHPHYNQRAKRGRGLKRKRGRKKCLSTDIHVEPPEMLTLDRFTKHMKEEDGRHTDAAVKIDFLKKCKEVGLLNDLFEELVDKLHLIQERLMGDTASDSDYEEIGTSLFDCKLFEDTFVNFQAAIQKKIHQHEERQQQLKEEIEVLQVLNQTMYFLQEDKDMRSSSTSVSSVSSKDYHFLNPE